MAETNLELSGINYNCPKEIFLVIEKCNQFAIYVK